MPLIKSQLYLFQNNTCIDSVHTSITENDSLQWVYPIKKEFAWTIDNYGAIEVPFKRLSIDLNHRSLIYLRTINRLEGVRLEEKDGKYYLEDSVVFSYTF